MSERVEFLIVVLENFAAKKEISGGDTERLFEKYRVDDYLLDSYDVMHTYPLETILSYVEEYIDARRSG